MFPDDDDIKAAQPHVKEKHTNNYLRCFTKGINRGPGHIALNLRTIVLRIVVSQEERIKISNQLAIGQDVNFDGMLKTMVSTVFNPNHGTRGGIDGTVLYSSLNALLHYKNANNELKVEALQDAVRKDLYNQQFAKLLFAPPVQKAPPKKRSKKSDPVENEVSRQFYCNHELPSLFQEIASVQPQQASVSMEGKIVVVALPPQSPLVGSKPTTAGSSLVATSFTFTPSLLAGATPQAVTVKGNHVHVSVPAGSNDIRIKMSQHSPKEGTAEREGGFNSTTPPLWSPSPIQQQSSNSDEFVHQTLSPVNSKLDITDTTQTEIQVNPRSAAKRLVLDMLHKRHGNTDVVAQASDEVVANALNEVLDTHWEQMLAMIVERMTISSSTASLMTE